MGHGQALHLKFLLWHLPQNPLQLQVDWMTPPVWLITAATLIIHQHNLREIEKHTMMLIWSLFNWGSWGCADWLPQWMCIYQLDRGWNLPCRLLWCFPQSRQGISPSDTPPPESSCLMDGAAGRCSPDTLLPTALAHSVWGPLSIK